MNKNKSKFTFVLLALLVVTLLATAGLGSITTSKAASLAKQGGAGSKGRFSILVIARASQAAAGNNNVAWILVHLANPDGTPITNAQIPGPDPNGGVELKNSRWEFQTLDVPPGYKQLFSTFVNGQRAGVELGELRIMAISNLGNGIYKLQLQPTAGLKGARKIFLRWVSGEYIFMVSYKDAIAQSTALGVLRIP